MPHQLVLWTVFNVFILFLLMLDLGVFHKKNHAVSIKESLVWSIIWIIAAFIFNAGIYFHSGPEKALEFLTCYIIERALSVDNIFVFIVIFSYFQVKAQFQYKILFWGILGALVMRALFIVTGITLVEKFHWLLYVFGAMLVYIGIKLAFEKEKEIHPEKNVILNLFKKFFPVTTDSESGNFTTRINGKLYATPLFLVLIVIETTDVIFALDSIPAALAITSNSFIIYSANVFAILGLRALYFALAGSMQIFHYLNYGLSVVLVFIGFKMLLESYIKIPIGLALGIVTFLIIASMLASVIKPKK
ncbi:MAG: tellurium resistance protein TerC [Elusimicrobia bacterium RIFOXYA2_FULL_39_19]|nr:MAG: tellurium resistance protein TerC [Elusimicrobia bacterium RIFOXYA2_FULL_39_19]